MNPLIPKHAQRDLVLASRSPRRLDILRGLQFEFDVVPAAEHVEDGVDCPDPYLRPVERARSKARDVSRMYPEATVIGADTVVLVGDDVLEKPRDEVEARRFIHLLSGREHIVISGLVVRRERQGVELEGSELTRVRFRQLDDAEVEAYVESGEGRDKAGSYAVQGLGAGLVSSIDGCFYNVVGLPVSLLMGLLKRLPG